MTNRPFYIPDENIYTDPSQYHVIDILEPNDINFLLTNCIGEKEEASVIGGQVGVRRSKIFWLQEKEPNNLWLYSRIWKRIKELNETYWKFDLTGFKDQVQYTEYNHEEKGHYDWHLDSGASVAFRKLSISILLQSAEEGGVFKILRGSEPAEIPLMPGQAVIFPSFLLHKVSEVTKGTRKSLVTWVAGSSLK